MLNMPPEREPILLYAYVSIAGYTTDRRCFIHDADASTDRALVQIVGTDCQFYVDFKSINCVMLATPSGHVIENFGRPTATVNRAEHRAWLET